MPEETILSIRADAERAAEATLRRVRVDPADLPIDPISIATRLGIEVWTSDLRDNVAGVIEKPRQGRPEIYLNASDHRRRQRFTCAHEIGHFDRHERGEARSAQYVDYRDDIAGRGTDPDEIYANSFAAALLMPADVVRTLHGKGYDVADLARKFDVSQQAMQNRIVNLRLALR